MRSPAAAGHVRSSSGGMGYRKQCPTCRRAFTHPPAFTIHRKSCGDEKSGGASPRGRVAAMSPRARPVNPLSVPPKPPPATKRQRQLAAREELSISLEMVQAAYAADLEALTPKPPPLQGPTLMDLDAHDDDADAEMARQLQRELNGFRGRSPRREPVKPPVKLPVKLPVAQPPPKPQQPCGQHPRWSEHLPQGGYQDGHHWKRDAAPPTGRAPQVPGGVHRRAR